LRLKEKIFKYCEKFHFKKRGAAAIGLKSRRRVMLGALTGKSAPKG
jgi:hypothetical protein